MVTIGFVVASLSTAIITYVLCGMRDENGRQVKIWISLCLVIIMMAGLIVGRWLVSIEASGTPVGVYWLDYGVHAVHGKVVADDGYILLWLAPVGGPAKDGKLYKVEGLRAEDVGPYLKKGDKGEVTNFEFEGK